ncbi:MAG TPA: hypothetical protein VF510_17985 [Ktedonobacterales bacterium]
MNISSPASTPAKRSPRPRGLTIVAVLMILFGLSEVVTGFTHNFFGLTTSYRTFSTVAAAAIGIFYVVGGALILTMRKWAAALAILLLGADIVGRVALVVTGVYPLTSFEQTAAILVGTLLAAFFALYVGSKWASFR